MDAKTVRSLLNDLDLERYTAAAAEKETKDEVWPPELEETFLTAARLFAPVGQRKYQLDSKDPNSKSTELCGRNDIISRYIFMKTSKYRTRKQVSSHIQVWVHCKRPPSSHSVDIRTFTELQKLFKDHYTRTSMEVHGSVKKRIRRVVSTSNVDALKKLSSDGSHALGISSSPIARSLAGTPANPRKHGMASSPEHASKRARRVVSEFPHPHPRLLLESIAAGGNGGSFGCGSSDNSSFMAYSPALTDSNSYSHWTPESYRQTPSQLSMFSHPATAPHPLLQPQVPTDMARSMLAQSALNLGLGLHPSYGMHDLPTAAPVSSTPVPSLAAATMAAMVAVDNALCGSAADAGNFTTRAPNPTCDIPVGVFPLGTSMPVPTPSHIMSAFATAVGASSAFSEGVNCSVSAQPELQRPEALNDVSLHSDGMQSFAEALDQYCHCTDDSEMSILSAVDECSSDVGANASAITDENKPPAAIMPVLLESDRLASKEMSRLAGASQASTNERHLSANNKDSTEDFLAAPANASRKTPGGTGIAPRQSSGPTDLRKAETAFRPGSAQPSSSPFFAVSSVANSSCAVEATHPGSRRENGLREFFKYIRSSPCGTHSTRSIGRDSDTTAGCGSSPPLPPHWASTGMPMAMDTHPVGTSADAAEASCLYTASTDIGCAPNAVSDWISSLQGMLDSQYGGQCIFQDGQPRNNGVPFLDPGIVGVRSAGTNNGVDVDNSSAAGGGGHGSAAGAAHAGFYAELCEYLRNSS
ncbi:hypothetical protein LPJ57_003037 [Coemansia sp. RSA 486]|nr:hypothetical protein LPJ57_003037 [Coemansia sp. RSA 486]KAJ2236245.1 hypothetical protein IWW45_001937 [Coemansia sp. RSA 485]